MPVERDERKMRFIEWLTTPPQFREPATEKELARELDVYYKTLYNWKNDRDFREVWQRNTDIVIGGEDKRQRIMETLYISALDYRSPRHVQAARLYLEAIGAMSPTKLDVTVSTKALSMLDDDELERLIARGAAELKAETDGERADGLPAEEHPG